MKRKRTYSSVDVETFDVSTVVSLLTVGCIVAIDVAKSKFVAAIATAMGEAVRLVRFEHPRQTGLFLRLLVGLQEAKLQPRVVMEPTGTYGDAVRYQCHRLQIPVHMMSPKHTHDFAEVIDGVASMHDPKAAVTLARLQAIQPARAWEPQAETTRDLRAVLDRRVPVARVQALYFGLLEGLLARHWPELDALVDVRSQRSWMTLLQRMPSPRAVAAASEEATEILRKASHKALSAESIAAIIESARSTVGVPMTHEEQRTVGAVVESLECQTRQLDTLDKQLASLCRNDPEMARMAAVVGPACAAAIAGYVGLPTRFSNARVLEKAMGLNLRERSSGEKKGRLHLTKRGPGEVRRLLFLAALRMLRADPIVAAWYQGRGSYRRGAKYAAIVAVMRKLARALWHVARGGSFDACKLFDVRRLDDATPLSGADLSLRASLSPQPQPIHPGGASQPTA